MAGLETAVDVSGRRNGTRPAWLAAVFPALALALPLGIYLRTLAPTVYSLDSPELVTAAYTLGVAHAPGYPLYTLLGWLFSHAVTLGDVAYRLNLLAAVLGATTVLLVYFVARGVTGRALVSLAAALLLGFSYWFWANSLAAEVYILEAFLLAAMLLFLLRWRRTGENGALFAFALFFGLCLANRTTSALFAPALAAYLLVSSRGTSRWAWLAMPAFVLVGLLFYAYIPLVYRSHPAYAWSGPRNLASLDGLWWLVSAKAFQPLVFAYGPAEALRNLGECLWWLSASFMGIGVALGLVGIWRQLVTGRRELMLLGGIALPQLIFFANYDAADREFMLLPVYVVWTVWLAIGASFIADLVRSYGLGIGASVATSAALLALPLLALSINYPLVDLSSERRPRQESEALLAAAGPDAVVVASWIEISPMLYLQKVEGQRPDIALLYTSGQDEQYLWDIVRTYAASRPVYISEEDAILQSQYDLLPVGQWFQVKPKGIK